ncbi:hypothetical protein MACH23_36370 [Sulfitobacter pontiacus]|nr:hypothetical protein MACH23_36370 [Sulfitobacter pontiacus]
MAAVKGRLRYGLIHPDIRAAARGKVITLDTMKAFAEHPSQEAQREVFEALTKDGGYLQAYTVRQALKSRGVQVSDDIGAFVRADYEARGGASQPICWMSIPCWRMQRWSKPSCSRSSVPPPKRPA